MSTLTYAHPGDLGTRFQQMACDPLPSWAVQIRTEDGIPDDIFEGSDGPDSIEADDDAFNDFSEVTDGDDDDDGSGDPLTDDEYDALVAQEQRDSNGLSPKGMDRAEVLAGLRSPD